jgi:probable rRNA maturation factor
MECNIFSEYEQEIISSAQIRKMIRKIFSQLGVDGAVSVHLVDDKKIQKLNEEHRDKSKPTDVLSFSIQEGFDLPNETTDLGDIFISIPTIKRQAKEYEVTNREEFIRMLVHGVLHLLGYDHKQDREAEQMFSLQRELIDKIYE